MKLLKNPYRDLKDYNCFGCSNNNPIGLKLDFYLKDDKIISKWKPGKNYEGFNNILHGGIQATLIDEVGVYAIFVLLGTSGVTSNLNIKYKNPVLIDKGKVKIEAYIKEKSKRITTVEVNLYDGEDTICAIGEVQYFVFPEELAIKKFNYPGKDAFIK